MKLTTRVTFGKNSPPFLKIWGIIANMKKKCFNKIFCYYVFPKIVLLFRKNGPWIIVIWLVLGCVLSKLHLYFINFIYLYGFVQIQNSPKLISWGSNCRAYREFLFFIFYCSSIHLHLYVTCLICTDLYGFKIVQNWFREGQIVEPIGSFFYFFLL